eukprot:11790720-Alexandrium_andersonii.AAC.1
MDAVRTYFRQHTVVVLRPGWRPQCACELCSKEGLRPRILGVLEIPGGAAKRYLPTPLPLASSGRAGPPPSRHVDQRARDAAACLLYTSPSPRD